MVVYQAKDPLIKQIIIPRDLFIAERGSEANGRGCRISTFDKAKMGQSIAEDMDIDSESDCDCDYECKTRKDILEPLDGEEKIPEIAAAYQLLKNPRQLYRSRPILIFWINDLWLDNVDLPGSVRIS